MSYSHLLVRYAELFLKGRNRPFFERKLVENIHHLTGFSLAMRAQGRLIYDYQENHAQLKQVFGIKSYSPTIKVEKNIENIKNEALKWSNSKTGTFKIETRRSDKSFPLTSLDINVLLGKHLEENNPNLKFESIHPRFILYLEINRQGAFLFTEIIDCFGGLPTGVEGKVALLLGNEADVLAGLLIMKRGTHLVLFSFKDFDYSLLQKYSPRKLKFKKITTLKEIKENIIVKGETFENYKKYNSSQLFLGPLISYYDQEILEKLKQFKL